MPEKLTLKQMRRLKNFTLEEVANSNKVRITREHLGRVENDINALKSLKIKTALDLVELYGYEISDLNFLNRDISLRDKLYRELK